MMRASDSPATSDRYAGLRRRVLALGVWGTLLLGAPTALQYVTLVAALWPLSPGPRGAAAANERVNFLGRSGYHGLRAKIAREGADPARSRVAKTWAWAAGQAQNVPADARVRVNAPYLAAYYYASFFWFPARVELSCGGRPVTGGKALVDACFVPGGEVSALGARGYTHALVEMGDGSVRLMALPRTKAGGT